MQSERTTKKQFISNPALPIVKSTFNGNEIINGAFQNLYGEVGGDSLWQVIKWRFSRNEQKSIKNEENYSLPVIDARNVLQEEDDFILWLGHASWLIQINGKKIITDPCLTSPPFVKRLTQLPIPIEALKPDYLLISHGHFDHLDTDTLKHFSGATALVPLNMTTLLTKINPEITCHEAGWYQQYDNTEEDFKITFLPAHHWHRRGSNDYNEILWGSFLVETKTITIYFGGDSAYSQHFRDIGKLSAEIDMAILPIAAYAPRWFMKSTHINPEEAMRAFKDLKAKRFIPMHYGTFDLSDEPLGEPERRIKKLAGQENVTFLNIGEKYLFNGKLSN